MRTSLIVVMLAATLPSLDGAMKRVGTEESIEVAAVAPESWTATIRLKVDLAGGSTCDVQLIAPADVEKTSTECAPNPPDPKPSVSWLTVKLKGARLLPLTVYLGGLETGSARFEIFRPVAKKIWPTGTWLSEETTVSGTWKSNWRLEAENAGCAVLRVVTPEKVSLTCQEQPPAPVHSGDPRFLTLTLEGNTPLPQTIYLMGLEGGPVRLEIPLPAPSPIGADRFVWLALLAALVTVVGGLIWARKSLWTKLGKQGWTFESFASNAALAVGLGVNLLNLLPGSNVPYTTLTNIFAFIAAAAPIAYNMTTRTENDVKKSRVIFFGCSAVMTGLAAFGQVFILHDTLVTAGTSELPKLSLWILQGVVVLVGAALAYRMVTSVRDTVDQQSAREALGVRGFPAP